MPQIYDIYVCEYKILRLYSGYYKCIWYGIRIISLIRTIVSQLHILKSVDDLEIRQRTT